MAIREQRLNVAELDYDQIKTNLKNFLKEQDVLSDYEYDGSAISTIIDLFAYVTHYNAFNANVALNETFLDSAQLRQSVVSHAKLLGYTPRSAFAPQAEVTITINNPIGVVNPDGTYKTITMDRGTQFTTSIEGTKYTFVTTETLVTSRDANGKYIFDNVTLRQGAYKNVQYIFDVDTSETFTIPQHNAVTSTLIVRVRDSVSSTNQETFVPALAQPTITTLSPVYWLQEGRDGLYEIYFGDGINGKKLVDGNVIELEYVVTEADAANGASVFSLADTIDGNSDVTITTLSRASGGGVKEDIDSIKFNAPLTFVSQNRAVTPDDYKGIILANYANVDAIQVWGGEDNDPPDYGKVYISIAPKDKEALTSTEKDFIIAQYLKPKNVVSITPTLIDPTYTYIYLEIFFKYNPNITSLSADALANLVRNEIQTYNDNELKRFDGVFRHSNVLRTVDDADPSILNSTVRVYMRKNITPELGVERRYDIYFSSPLYITDANESIIETTEFTYQNRTCRIEDVVLSNGIRRLQIVTGTGISRTVLNTDVGYVNEADGHVILTGFAPQSIVGDHMEFTVVPNSFDLAPKRNELLSILVDVASIEGSVDTMITGGTSAGVDYETTPSYGY